MTGFLLPGNRSLSTIVTSVAAKRLASVETLQRLRLPDVAIRLKEGTIILLGVLCALLAESGCSYQQLAAGWGVLLLPIIILFAVLARRGVTSFALILTTSASLLGLAFLMRM